MNNKKQIRERFTLIFYSTGLRLTKFADLLEISPSGLRNYLNGSNNILNLCIKLYELGYSINWLVGGMGKMIHDDEQNKYYPILNENYKLATQKRRITKFIMTYYSNFESFSEEFDCEPGEMEYYLKGNKKIFPYKLLVKLRKAGCNIKWTIGMDNSMVADNYAGKRLLRRQYRKNILEGGVNRILMPFALIFYAA